MSEDRDVNTANLSTHKSAGAARYPGRLADPLAAPRTLPPVLSRWDHPVRLSPEAASRAYGLGCGSRW